ncbi:NUDIX domain-containing protein [Arenimonas fontis]|uniref:NUDIX domain-containing protein n=1 Tax=Arenimonas fontis TaxID=2608255 RepID=A0A5B2ZC77_9GAMM|nr:NUDIX domain-containing protein [Arenimonas fontis]
MDTAVIRTVAAVIRDAGGRVLLVRKRGTSTFIQPGGKREPGEDAWATLARELDEEIGVGLRGEPLPLGEFEDVAVNEPGWRVRAEVFLVEVEGEPEAGAEIEELAWVDPADPGDRIIAPLSRDRILPAVASLAAGQALPVPPGPPRSASPPGEGAHLLPIPRPIARGDHGGD